MAHLILVGVGHIFNLEERIKKLIIEEKPNAIAIELDFKRALALLEKKHVKSQNLFYSLMAKLQNLIANKYGVKAGNEMLAAIKTGYEMNIPIIYIDKDAGEIINRLWKEISIVKKFRLIIASFFSLFIRKRKVEEEIKKFEKNPDEFMEKIEENLPEVKKILIDERNEYMANNLKKALKEYDKVLAIVGEGHISGIKKLLENEKNIELKIIHLSDLIN